MLLSHIIMLNESPHKLKGQRAEFGYPAGRLIELKKYETEEGIDTGTAIKGPDFFC